MSRERQGPRVTRNRIETTALFFKRKILPDGSCIRIRKIHPGKNRGGYLLYVAAKTLELPNDYVRDQTCGHLHIAPERAWRCVKMWAAMSQDQEWTQSQASPVRVVHKSRLLHSDRMQVPREGKPQPNPKWLGRDKRR